MGEVKTKKTDTLLLVLVLVAAHHAVTYWLFWSMFRGPAHFVYRNYGPHAYDNFYDGLSVLTPLLLCIGSPRQHGLRIGDWITHRWKLLGVTLGPVIAVFVCSRYTSQPFAEGRIGSWLISPAAQDMLFAGYIYTLLASAFPGPAARRLGVGKAVFLTAAFFSLWHVPNFTGMSAPFVAFQLLYTFLFGLCSFSARQWTGSIVPGLLSHMACNLLAWIRW